MALEDFTNFDLRPYYRNQQRDRSSFRSGNEAAALWWYELPGGYTYLVRSQAPYVIEQIQRTFGAHLDGKLGPETLHAIVAAMRRDGAPSTPATDVLTVPVMAFALRGAFHGGQGRVMLPARIELPDVGHPTRAPGRSTFLVFRDLATGRDVSVIPAGPSNFQPSQAPSPQGTPGQPGAQGQPGPAGPAGPPGQGLGVQPGQQTGMQPPPGGTGQSTTANAQPPVSNPLGVIGQPWQRPQGVQPLQSGQGSRPGSTYEFLRLASGAVRFVEIDVSGLLSIDRPATVAEISAAMSFGFGSGVCPQGWVTGPQGQCKPQDPLHPEYSTSPGATMTPRQTVDSFGDPRSILGTRAGKVGLVAAGLGVAAVAAGGIALAVK